MKAIFFFSVFFFFSILSVSQITNPHYDDLLSKKLHADEYGLKTYVLVILKGGSNHLTDSVVRASLFNGHFSNINKLVSLKKMVVVGPLEKNSTDYHGIFILDVNSIEEAKILMQNDPTIEQKIFEAEYFTWYGSAALPEYLDEADKIWKRRP
jgi:uncharacterized protein YciI